MFQVDDSLWLDKLARYAAATGKGMVETLDEEFPLLVEVIVKLTPPKTLAQGRGAVRRDISKTMRPFDPQAIQTEGIREIVQRKDVEAYNIVSGRVKAGPMRGTSAIAFSPEVHTRRRNAYGRIGSDSRQVVLGSDAGLLRRYIAEVQKRVGYAKSGWLAALRLVGGRSAQAFVERHGTAGGAVQDDRKNPDRPSITAINRTPWAARRDEAHRIVNDALDSRAVSIRAKITTKWRLARQAAGFDKAA